MINIVGLGATDKYGLTLEAVETIKNSHKNYIRTEKHASVEYFIENNIKFSTFDYLYDDLNTFDEVYSSIVEELLKLEKEEGIINYYVPGNPLIAESTVVKLIDSGVKYNIVMGMSFIEPVLRAVKRDPSEGFILLDGDKFNKYDIDVHSDVLVTQIYNDRTASSLKLDISEIYGDEYMIYLITNAGLVDEDVYYIPIYELDRINNINHQSAVYIPKTEKINNLSDLLLEIDKSLDENILDIENIEKFNDDIENSDILCEALIYAMMLIKISDYEGIFTFNEIIAKTYKKIAENSDFIKNTMEK